MVEFESTESQMTDLSGKSLYHGGLTKVLRMDSYCREADFYRTRLRLPEWKRKLDSLWIELRMFAKKDKRKEYEDIKSQKVNPHLDAYNKAPTESMKNDLINGAYSALLELELFLKDLSYEAALETPLSSDPRYSMSGKRG